MGTTVSLDSGLVSAARSYSSVESRSVPKQIEHWAKIGRIVEDNPDLNYSAIKNILLGLSDIAEGDVEDYNGSL